MSERFSYAVYGLHVRSDFALWPWGGELTATARADVSFELAHDEVGFPETNFRPGLQDAVLRWPGVGAFWIRAGVEVRVAPAPGAAPDEIALVAAGPVLALLLEQRGQLVLHGSCVELGGRAVTLLGESGAGKSTIAASLRHAGYPLVSDGMTVVDCSGAEPLALPGPAHLKLWPDAIRSLKSHAVRTQPVARREDKLWYQTSGAVASRPVPLRQAFVLRGGSEVTGERLTSAAGLVALIKNHFLVDFADAESRVFIMERCARLASRISVSTLTRGKALSDMPSVLARVLAATSNPVTS